MGSSSSAPAQSQTQEEQNRAALRRHVPTEDRDELKAALGLTEPTAVKPARLQDDLNLLFKFTHDERYRLRGAKLVALQTAYDSEQVSRRADMQRQAFIKKQLGTATQGFENKQLCQQLSALQQPPAVRTHRGG
jgi:hypothetical protein